MNAAEQDRYLKQLEWWCRPARLQGAEPLTVEDREALAAIVREADFPGDGQIRAASLLALAGDGTAIESICGWMEGEALLATRFATLIDYRILPLAQSDRFVRLIIPRLNPADPEWTDLLKIVEVQGVKEARPRLESILLAGEFLPEWNVVRGDPGFEWLFRLAYLVSLHNTSMEMLEATLRYLEPARKVPVELQPWSALIFFAGEKPQRRRILEFLKAVGDPPEPFWWCGYETMLCRLGDRSDLPEIDGLLDFPKPIHGSMAETFVRLLGREAVPRLLGLLHHPRWGLGATGQLGELLRGTGHPEAVAELGKLAGETSETQNMGRRLLGILQTVLFIGGPAAHAVVGEHILRVPLDARTDLWWDWSGLKLEDLAECLVRYGANGGRSPAVCRERHPGYWESRMMWCLFGDHYLAVDCQSDEVPLPHGRLLEHIADQLDWLGFHLNHISQMACGPDEDGACQYEIRFEFDRVHHAFLASTRGNSYDLDSLMAEVEMSIEDSRPGWGLFTLHETGAEILDRDQHSHKIRHFCQFLVIPRSLKAELTSRFGIAFYEPEVNQ